MRANSPRLAGQSIHQIDVQHREANLPNEFECSLHAACLLRATNRAGFGFDKTLHADADAIDCRGRAVIAACASSAVSGEVSHEAGIAGDVAAKDEFSNIKQLVELRGGLRKVGVPPPIARRAKRASPSRRADFPGLSQQSFQSKHFHILVRVGGREEITEAATHLAERNVKIKKSASLRSPAQASCERNRRVKRPVRGLMRIRVCIRPIRRLPESLLEVRHARTSWRTNSA